jgi:hypothetical protein
MQGRLAICRRQLAARLDAGRIVWEEIMKRWYFVEVMSEPNATAQAS